MRSRAGVLGLVAMLAGCTPDRIGPWEPAPSPPSSNAAHRPLPDRDTISGRRLPSDVSAVIVGAVTGAPLAGLLLAAIGLAWLSRRRARAERAVDPVGPLADGPATICGAVEVDPGTDGPVAEARIHQRGAETKSKGTWSHQWTEVDRNVWARPFHVRRDDGILVRIEPGERVTVRDAHLSIVRRIARDARTRSSTIRAGALVRVTGELTGAAEGRAHAHAEPVYRGTQPGLLLRPPRYGKMVISTEPPGDTEAARARFHARWAMGIATIMAILGGAVVPDYLVLAADGDRVSAAVVAVQRREEWVKSKNSPGFWTPHHRVRARADIGAVMTTLEDECGPALYACVKAGTCPRVSFVVSAHAPSFHQVGSGPTLPEGRLPFLLLSLFAVLVGYPASAFGTRPWYRRWRIVDYGIGRLDDG